MTDIWQNLAGQETAKRAIEIAMVGGLAITFIPVEGAGYSFTAYDVGQLKGETREKAQARMDAYDGEPMSIAAAADTILRVRAVADDLAARCGLPALVTSRDTADMRIDIQPVTIADFILPPPAEPVEIVVSRVMAAVEKLPSIKNELTYEATALFNNWTRLVPTAPVDAAIEMARCILALGGYVSREGDGTQISRLCLAEAISYCRR